MVQLYLTTYINITQYFVMGLFWIWQANRTGATGIVSSETGGSKGLSEPSMGLASARNDSALDPETAKAIKVDSGFQYL